MTTPKSEMKPTLLSKKFERQAVPALIADTSIILVVGRKGSGKSHLVCKLLKTVYRGIYDRIIFVSPTFEAQLSLWGTLSPDGISVFSEITDFFLTNLLAEQMEKRTNHAFSATEYGGLPRGLTEASQHDSGKVCYQG